MRVKSFCVHVETSGTQPRAGILRIFFYKTESVSSPETLSVLLFFIFSCGVSGDRTTPEGASFDTGYRASIRVDQVARDIKDQAETEPGERLPGESVIGRLVDLVKERLACCLTLGVERTDMRVDRLAGL